jgi:hypothetical protein
MTVKPHGTMAACIDARIVRQVHFYECRFSAGRVEPAVFIVDGGHVSLH